MDFDIGDSELEYLYDYYYPFEEEQTIGDNLKLQESPVTLNMEDENNAIVCLMYKLVITSEQENLKTNLGSPAEGESDTEYIL
ncbi:hypothetical protein CEXT_223161 [Caerostris extrusa]|uniref:Uncharacterized protein n=1 Tax=Caerostris extrusa TaxID=172846 RepID=A0AAV4TEN2_CAEEX|nr:hypothetical protein CEXT_223161 [Caerostris extrusa]